MNKKGIAGAAVSRPSSYYYILDGSLVSAACLRSHSSPPSASSTRSPPAMDYRALSDRQIRLLTILPAPLGTSGKAAPVHCTTSLRVLPTTDPAHDGALPSHYISFDPCVPDPPVESHVDDVRHLLAPLLEDMGREKKSRLSRAMDEVRGKVFRRQKETHGLLRPRAIVDFLSPEEQRRILTSVDTNQAGMECRIWRENSQVTHIYDDAAGYNILMGTSTTSEPVLGSVPVRALNPFFRYPDPDPDAYIKSVKDVVTKKPSNFVAMSYTWGPAEPTAEIVVDGNRAQVRANLEAGLRRFRDMDYFRLGGKIWIDALCINQQDQAEIEKQVQMMASIYRHAGNVIVWLGPDTPESDQAISYLEKLGREYRAEYAEAMDAADPVTANTWRTMARVRMETAYDKAREMLGNGEELYGLAGPLYDFFDRPYWRRLWIIQELCAGRPGMPIVCGNRVTQWRYIRDAVLLLTSALDIMDETMWERLRDRRTPLEHSLLHVAQIAQLEIVGHRRTLASAPTEQLPLVVPTLFEDGPLLGGPMRRAVSLALQSGCSVPHDRIYGLLNIPGLPDLGIKVEYSKPLRDVFTEFSAACVKHRSLDFFGLVDGEYMLPVDENGNPQKGDKPSWVPNYDKNPRRRIGILDGEWCAGGHVPVGYCMDQVGSHIYSSSEAPQISDDQCLVCTGKVVDAVDGTGAISRADCSEETLRNPSKRALLLSVRQPSGPADGDTAARANAGTTPLYDVLVGGCDMRGAPAPASFECLYDAFPVQEPPAHSQFYRNWHFLKSSADLLIDGRPLSSYFAHLATPTATDAPAPRPARETAAARQAMAARTKHRRLIVTKAGRLGLAPAQTLPGDAVITIVGHPKPVIARKVDTAVEGQDLWHLLGEAYVPGIMNAEAMPLSTKPWYYRETMEALDSMDCIVFV